MKIRSIVLAGLLAASASAAAQDQNADAITGIWETKSGGYVQIYDAGGAYVGKIVGSRSGEPRYDKNNPDPEKRGRRLLGTTLVRGLQYEGDMTWGGGEIYAPDSGELYSLKAYLRAPDKLEVRGYVGFSLFGRSQMWNSVSLDAPNLQEDLLMGELAQKAAAKTGAGSEPTAE